MTNEDIEQILLSQSGSNELIARKIKEEILAEIKTKTAQKKVKKIKSLDEVPAELIFSRKSTWSIYNRETCLESLINGAQAESHLTNDLEAKKGVLSGKIDCFLSGRYFLRFVECEIA